MRSHLCYNHSRRLRVNHFVKYEKICEGLECKQKGKVRVYAFGGAQIVCESGVIYFSECDKIVRLF